MDKLVLAVEMSKTGADPALAEWNFIKFEVIRSKNPAVWIYQHRHRISTVLYWKYNKIIHEPLL